MLGLNSTSPIHQHLQLLPAVQSPDVEGIGFITTHVHITTDDANPSTAEFSCDRFQRLSAKDLACGKVGPRGGRYKVALVTSMPEKRDTAIMTLPLSQTLRGHSMTTGLIGVVEN